jgi:AraC family transcriptional regulator, transcriptional activator for feuABC-ybbA operon
MKRSLISEHVLLPENSESLGVVCTAVGYEYALPEAPIQNVKRMETSPFSGKPFCTDEWLLAYIINGSFLLMLEGDIQHTIKQGMVTVIPPGTWYRFDFNQHVHTCIHYVSFKGKALAERKVCTAIDELLPVTEVGFNIEVVELFQRLLETSKSTAEGSQRELGASIVLLVAKLVNCKHVFQSIHTRPSMIDQAKIMMHTHINDHISIEDIAREVKVPLSTFRRTFKKTAGVSPYQYLLQCKIEYAKRDLLRTDTPQRTIAEKLGFSDQYHFSRVFQHITGMRPTQWRKDQQDSDH